jgi:hypothetical protein
VMACLTDAAPPATADSAIDTPADTRFDTLVDTTKEIPGVDAELDSLAVDMATDVSSRLDTAPACPAIPPTSGYGPCPAGGVCEYTHALECDAGCSGGTYLRYECINDLWQQTRATAGAPACYCPTILDAPVEVARTTCTDSDRKTYALGDSFKKDCNTCRCAISPDDNKPAIACTVVACTVDAATVDGLTCASPSVWYYPKAGCDGTVGPVCGQLKPDACLGLACGCDGETLAGCDGLTKPYRSLGRCP